ncbi:hypothetical protein AB3X55_00150 [Alphaproteobacteria bacterium LSUCC0719]
MLVPLTKINACSTKGMISLNVLHRFLRQLTFLLCIKVAVAVTQSDPKFLMFLSVLVLFFVSFIIVEKLKFQRQEDFSKFGIFCRMLLRIRKRSDHGKLYAACVAFYTAVGLGSLFFILIIALSGSLRQTIICFSILAGAFYYKLYEKFSTEVLVMTSFLVLILYLFFFQQLSFSNSTELINVAIIFFVLRYFLFEIIRALKAHNRLGVIYASLV